MSSDSSGRLVTLDRSNWRAALDVRVTDEQLPLVADHQPVALVVLAKAHVRPDGRHCEPLGFVDSDGSIVAVLALFHGDGVAEVNNLAVDHRRQRSGVGTRVMDAVIRRCRDAGETAVELTVNPRNDTATRLYERGGFRPTGEIRDGEPVLRIST